MPGIRYRIKEPTVALFQDDGRGVANRISAGTIVELGNVQLTNDGLIEVMWNGRAVMMFTQDLRSRAEEIE